MIAPEVDWRLTADQTSSIGFIGTTGVMRVVTRTCEIMKELGTDDPARVREAGGIDLPTLQKYINFHFSVSVDLFGQEVSTNAANYYTAGLKGRFEETKIDDDHKLGDAQYPILELEGEKFVTRETAEEIYGVILSGGAEDGTLAIDTDATQARRGAA